MKKGLNIGCGPIHLDSDYNVDWENSDFSDSESAQSWKIEKKRDFTAPLDDLTDDSVDYIVAWHIIEHVGLHQNAALIKEWLRVLKPGGKLFIACPNIKAIAQNIVVGTPPWNDPYIAMVNLFGPYNGYDGDYHKWGYMPESLSELLVTCGFSQVNQTLTPQLLGMEIGANASKMGFADYNLQMEATK